MPPYAVCVVTALLYRKQSPNHARPQSGTEVANYTLRSYGGITSPRIVFNYVSCIFRIFTYFRQNSAEASQLFSFKKTYDVLYPRGGIVAWRAVIERMDHITT